MNETLSRQISSDKSSSLIQELSKDPLNLPASLLHANSGINDHEIEDEACLSFNNFSSLVKSTPFVKYAPDRSPTLSMVIDSSKTSSTCNLHLEIESHDSSDSNHKENDYTSGRRNFSISPKNRALPLGRKSLFSKYSKEYTSTIKLDTVINV